MYRVECPSCGKPYDAEKARDCQCLQPVRSFQCPNCAACFCNAPKSFIDGFWKNATQAMWERRRARGSETAATAKPVDETAKPVDAAVKTVLFADDDATSRAIARRVVESLGYAVVLASDGEEALDLARQYRPELIITDALMPRLDGREMARTIRQEYPDTKIVVITSVYKDPRYKHEALRNFGVDDFLTKPIAPGDLRAIVQKYVG